MVLVVMLAAAAVIAGALAYSGLFGSGIKLSATSKITGAGATLIGLVCLVIAIVAGAAAVWLEIALLSVKK